MRSPSFDERGQVAGVETLAFGVLVFVVGTLVAVNAWSVVATRAAADEMAREYLRAYSEATSPAAALVSGRRALDAVATGRGLELQRVALDAPEGFGPCAWAEVGVTVSVPLVRLPLVGGLGATEVRVRHGERVDGFRVMASSPEAEVGCG